ncbi:MAG: tetratricopeptide repeat protein [Lachnospiraceae bacterium]|nr:tetratricopeptide repeat protein [Lachnospiraceae bacterium]
MGHNNGNLAKEDAQVKMSVVESKPTAKKKPVNENEPTAKKKMSDGDRPATKKKEVSEDKPAAKKKAVSEDKPAAKKKAVSEDKPAAKKKAVGEDKPAVKKKAVGGDKNAARKKAVSKDKSTVRKKTSGGKKKTVKKMPAETKKKDAAVNSKSEGGEDFESRMKKRDEERARRKAERLRRVRRQKIMMAVSSVVIVAAVIVIVIFCTPSMQLSRSLDKGDKCAARAEYAEAQGAYEKALEIDTGSVRAYRGLASNYLAQEQTQEAKQIVYTGWEQTQDSSLLDYYCIVVYNEAVGEINNKNCTLATVDKCIQVLEQKADHEDALNLMGTCYERLFQTTEDNMTCEIFYDEDIAQDTCSYAEYEQLLRRLLAVYQSNPSEAIKNILTQYALIDMPYVRISMPHMTQYMTLLTDINTAVGNEKITETLACLLRAKEVTDYFETAFAEFENGNYAYARDLIAQESYQQIRDSFINENSGYWEGTTYIPVNREQIVLHNENGQVRFSFLSSDEYNNKQGIISVWGTKQEDDGVQRSAISYEPVADAASGEHTMYKVQYLYSNVKIGNKYEPQMNYRFDTEITTAEGTTTNAIGDWGGEHEWEIDY